MKYELKNFFNTTHCTKMKLSIKNFQETADIVTFTEEILNGKLHFLCSDRITITKSYVQN